jgi:hypothetical protein
MASLPEILKKLEGAWIMSHKNSDKFEDILSAQGVGWVRFLSYWWPRLLCLGT